ncbi:hypothetical protein C1637_16905 [Chryseobacterium lactis]|uniref:Uncharacterized protein n=1 Tax=Chryseobacterium lactis TaxID=1241981 RepID=A0A3G6RIC6_CHRLC|nr:hypothetical protein [Chryseobacterium lactis]AZA84167.1 hypothetical protein EG342_20745 [Chryseobacterium lactis]AZB04555.1 hypothetical protein EG341_11625 [Chryseobacterium lactis]PNW12722.1 hypothetical protein C1637_16905 [Chryseobacterium lactis]
MSRNKNLLIMLIVIVMVFLYNLIFPSKNKGSFLDEVREKEIKSIVSKKYINYDNHNIAFVVYGNKDSIVVYRDWWDKIVVGDSIIKPKGSLEVIIKNSDKFEKFNYEDKFGLDNQ